MSRSIEIYTPLELSGALGMPYRLILRAIKTERLKCHKVNSRVFFITAPNAARWFNSLSDRHNSTQVNTTPFVAGLPCRKDQA